MTWDGFSPVGGSLAEYLDRADALILPRQRSETAPPTPVPPAAKLRVGVDLGTAYLVLVVLDETGLPGRGVAVRPKWCAMAWWWILSEPSTSCGE